jgi:hypothetical protein
MKCLFRRGTIPASATLLLAVACLQAQSSHLIKCDMTTTFAKPWFGDTEWIHNEKQVVKYFLIDDSSKMVSVYNDRTGVFTPICSSQNTVCGVKWTQGNISIDGTKMPDNPVPPHIDFRRSFTLTDGSRAELVLADFGESMTGKANMTWTFDGSCQKQDAKPTKAPPPSGSSPTYRNVLVMPISQQEQNAVLAPRVGNTVTGLSAGGRSWFHMWLFNQNGLAYLGDGDDMSTEAKPRTLFFGKEAGGSQYRICFAPIPAEGEHECYPLVQANVGDSWTEEDHYGPALFTLLKGRQ